MIGVFDSGVGGLGVLAHIRRELPGADLLYLADQGRAPYGTRSLDEVAAISEEVTSWLLGKGATTVVVACNTASAAAISRLREIHPSIPFVGMEPAVKPAAIATKSGVIGVLATAATFQGELYSSVVSRHAPDVQVLNAACPMWVRLVEEGRIKGREVERQVAQCLAPLIEGGADVLVLGCTHFPFLRPVIEQLVGSTITVVDPAPAVALQVARVHVEEPGEGDLVLVTTASPRRLARLARDLAGIEPTRPVLAWSPE
ncbi:MAG TPA: glutamate racemase [Acidimicrobiia bacterium]|nr:glutamate racemase [Acidimicrobiia bacterium]